MTVDLISLLIGYASGVATVALTAWIATRVRAGESIIPAIRLTPRRREAELPDEPYRNRYGSYEL